MPTVAPGKVRRDWYIDEDVAVQLRVRCAEQHKIESHVVTEAIRAMLELTKPEAALEAEIKAARRRLQTIREGQQPTGGPDGRRSTD